MTSRANLNEALSGRVASECQRQGILLDSYDPDFILGVVMEWLGANDAALTKTGVRRFRR